MNELAPTRFRQPIGFGARFGRTGDIARTYRLLHWRLAKRGRDQVREK